MPHIFISYAKRDTRQLAFALDDALNHLQGVTSWVDRSMRAGKNWELQIQAEIDKCDFMVVLYSPDINRHKQGEKPSYMLKEIAYAQHTVQKPIIPVMAQQTTPPLALITEHYLDYVGIGMTLEMLVKELCDEMNILIQSYPQYDLYDRNRVVASEQHKQSSLDLLPKPFAWISIPDGIAKGEYGNYGSYFVSGFQMAKYPVTNAQYKLFIDAGGYHEKYWWTEDGWQAKLDAKEPKKRYMEKTGKEWIKPCFWDEAKWNRTDYPIVGISFHEAIAFCNWLSHATSEKIMLPTELQWQRAAQGDDGRIYPWGNEWGGTQCNNSVSPNQSNRTTYVRDYEGEGDSPFGVTDMAGNVQEWCLKSPELEISDLLKWQRRLHGGSWSSTRLTTFLVSSIVEAHPDTRENDIGFRICLF